MREEQWVPKDGAEQGTAALFSVGVAEAVVRSEFDPVDVVAEVVNRVEHALGQALGQGLGHVAALAGERWHTSRRRASDSDLGLWTADATRWGLTPPDSY